MSEDAEIRGVIPTYYSFIVEKLNRIYDAWDKNDFYSALLRSIRLVSFLPRKIKKQILPEKKRIELKLIQAQSIKGRDFNSTQMLLQQRVRQVAMEEVGNFVNLITEMLDQEGLLVMKHGVPTVARGMGDIQRTVDKARFEVEA